MFSLCYNSLEFFVNLAPTLAIMCQKYLPILTALDLRGVEKANEQGHALVCLVWNSWNISPVLKIF